MSARSITAGAALAGAAVAALSFASYRRDIAAARARLAEKSRIAPTPAGLVEYGEEGAGEPLLLIHGAGGGFDQGLIIGRDFGEGRRVIAPSRFGYLKTPVPEDASPAAQADAHAALLDYLDVAHTVVVGASAGGPSAIELALRHPDRVAALVLLVPRTYDPSQSVGPDESFESQLVLRLIEGSADFLYWLMTKVARRSVVRFLGVLPEVEAGASEAERAKVTDIMRSVLPLSDRIGGLTVDGSTALSAWPLHQLKMPVLIVSAEDDLFGTLPGARFTAEQIPQAELHVLPSGGHLMVGKGEQVSRWVADFLCRNRIRECPLTAVEVIDAGQPAEPVLA